MNRYILFLVCWMALAVITCFYLLKYKTAPYGKFSSANWGPMIDNRLGWFIMEITVIVAFLAQLPLRTFAWFTPKGLMVALFFLHYVYRSIVYPLMIRTRGKKKPAVIMLSAILFNAVNGSVLGLWFARYVDYSASWLYSLPFIIGVILFFTGMVIHQISDYYLIHLRKKDETDYKLPVKGLFKYVTSPNLLGEITEWLGYALLTWSLPALAFFLWTCANLLPRAAANQKWYREKFPNYPKKRKILFPFVW
jgi:protein-S-isoprenylcysteine O-methyltransferase Ste14